MKAVIIGAVIQTARPFGRIVALLLFASLATSTHASSEYLLPATDSGGRSVRYFADHELKTVDGHSEYAVVMVHGVSGGNADCTKRVRGLLKGTPTEGKVFFVAPCFPILPMLDKADEKRIVYWQENKWQAGNDSPVAANLSPYDVLDAIFADLNDPRLYPQLKHVLFCGYSAGAQIVSRYMAVSRIKARKGLAFSFAAGAPSSWLFMDKSANWHYGLGNRNRYAGSLSNSEIFQNVKSRHIVCFCGTADTETKNLSTTPLAMKQGANRYERFKNFRSHISTFEELRKSFEFIEVEGIGHSGKCWNGVNFEKLVLGAKEQYAREAELRDGFVLLANAVPDAILEIRYYSTYNFVGERIDGYEQPCALLSKEAAKALKAASDDCVKRGYRLKIYDAYRPRRAVAHFVRWADDIGDTRMKAPFYPNLDKSVLFKQGYIAERSGHSRGSTVDLTLFDMKTGKEVDMGGTFDWFGEESHPSYRGITDAQFKNRMLLRDIMVAHGFKPIAEEWWHFTLANEPYPDTYFDFPVRE